MRDQRLVGFARANRVSMSDAERIIWYHVRHQSYGVRFRRQHPIGPYIADFACVSRRLVIEIDGSQHKGGSGRDRSRDRYMTARGWTVLRFWSWDVVGNRERVLQTIGEALHPPPFVPPFHGGTARTR